MVFEKPCGFICAGGARWESGGRAGEWAEMGAGWERGICWERGGHEGGGRAGKKAAPRGEQGRAAGHRRLVHLEEDLEPRPGDPCGPCASCAPMFAILLLSLEATEWWVREPICVGLLSVSPPLSRFVALLSYVVCAHPLPFPPSSLRMHCIMQPPPHPVPSDDDGANSDDDPALLAPSPSLPPPDPLLHAPVLTQEQLLHRRASRLRHLLRIYHAQYWGLLEEMRSKYRRFYLRHGKSGWRRDPGPGTVRDEPDLPPGEMKQPHAPEPPGSDLSRCSAQGCLAKPLLLSSYCYTHILQEPRQRLYKPCSFIVRRGSGKNANIVCQKPVLQAVSPPLCPTHFQQTQKQSGRSLRKAGIVLPRGSFSKSTPKLHHFVAGYVRVIQSKRRAFRIAQGRGETSVSTHRELAQGLVAGTSKQGALQRNIHKTETEEQQATANTRAGEASSKPIVV